MRLPRPRGAVWAVEEVVAMSMVRDVAPVERLTYLASLGFDPDDAGRLVAVDGRADQTGLYVEAETGRSLFLGEGDPVPGGIWVAQRDIDDLKPSGGVDVSPTGHGFGEGWGRQAEQVGGDRSYAEEDSGGTRRVPHGGVAENVDPFVDDPVG
jgi:hypothetical protein